jgi:hypothetical protein
MSPDARTATAPEFAAAGRCFDACECEGGCTDCAGRSVRAANGEAALGCAVPLPLEEPRPAAGDPDPARLRAGGERAEAAETPAGDDAPALRWDVERTMPLPVFTAVPARAESSTKTIYDHSVAT